MGLNSDVLVYLMYAVQPPPNGPLEDQDQEDEGAVAMES